jgi:hypothetical protein
MGWLKYYYWYYYFNVDCFLTKFGFITLFGIHKILKNVLICEVMSFSSSYEILHPKCGNAFIYNM